MKEYRLSFNLSRYIENFKISNPDYASHLRLIQNELDYWINQLHAIPAENRAEYTHKLIDAQKIEYKATEGKNRKISCKRGCHFCCVSNIEVTSDEFLFLKENYSGISSSQTDKHKCVFLQNDECSIYEKRPAICRNREVVSPPENCKTMQGEISLSVVLKAEIIASAAMTVADAVGSFGFLIEGGQ
jgi:Fe-S-cluster containining protein